MATKEQVIGVLKQVMDPEINLDIWTLGLVYDVQVNEGVVKLVMTFTTPTCPYGPMLLEDVKMNIKQKTDAADVDIEVTFDPPWQPNEELRSILGV